MEFNDLVMFFVFYEFFVEVVVLYFDFGFELLIEYVDLLFWFFIFLFWGVWDGDRKVQFFVLMIMWINEVFEKEMLFLSVCVKVFLLIKDVDFDIFDKIFEKVICFYDVFVIC